jgi:hypothetical protein
LVDAKERSNSEGREVVPKGAVVPENAVVLNGAVVEVPNGAVVPPRSVVEAVVPNGAVYVGTVDVTVLVDVTGSVDEASGIVLADVGIVVIGSPCAFKGTSEGFNGVVAWVAGLFL